MRAIPLIVLCCVAGVGPGCSMQSAAEADEDPQPAATTAFLVIYRPGPAWVEGKPVTEQTPKAHGRYMLSLFVKGPLKLAGPFMDDSGGAVVLEVADEAKARAIVARDPAVESGIFLYEMHPWRTVQWERYLEK